MLIGRPTDADAKAPLPTVVSIKRVATAAARRRASATACWPRPFPPQAETGPAYTGPRHQDLRQAREAVLGVFRVLHGRHVPHRAGRARGKPNWSSSQEFRNGAKDGDLVEVEPQRASAASACRAPRC